MNFLDIKTTRVFLTDDDKFILNEAVRVIGELLDHMNEVESNHVFKDPYDKDEFISYTEVEKTLKNIEFIKEAQGTN